jgi:hypothetical protein
MQCKVLPQVEKGEKHTVVFTLVLLRRPAYYHHQIIVPLHLIVTLAVLTLIENTHSDMVSITLTLILTSVAFRYTVNDKLPPCAYQTVLDKDLNICLCFLFAFVVENAVAVSQDRVSRWVSGSIVAGAWAIYNVVYFLRQRAFQQATRMVLRRKHLKPLITDLACSDSDGTELRLPDWRVL